MENYLWELLKFIINAFPSFIAYYATKYNPRIGSVSPTHRIMGMVQFNWHIVILLIKHYIQDKFLKKKFANDEVKWQ